MKLIRWLDENLEEFVMIILLILIACIMMAQVVMRYVFASSMSWPEECCRYLWIATTCFSLGYVVKKDNALKVEVIMEFLAKPVRRAVETVINVLMMILHGYMAYHTFLAMETMRQTGQLSPAMRMSMWLLYLLLAGGFLLGTFRYAEHLIRQGKGGETTC